MKALFALTLILAPLGPACGASPDWKAGTARMVITPQEPMWMAGYGARTNIATGKLQDLFAKALVLEDPVGHRLVLVTTDLVGMRAALTDPVADELGRKHGLAREQILFTSSHTHCGPLLTDKYHTYPATGLAPVEEEKLRRYTERLRGQLVQVVGEALSAMAPARLAWTNGKAGFAVNRREPTPRGIINGTNLLGPVDHDVPGLRVESVEGRLLAVAFGYACHNTTLSFYQWCGDYAGFAQEYLEAAHPGATVLFFMGCGGDANPLPRGTVELCQKYGRQLADAVETVLAGRLHPISGSARLAFARVDLPLDKLPTRDELEAQAKGKPSYTQRRAVGLLQVLAERGTFATTYPYPIQVWHLGSGPTWIALGGEAVVDYSHRLKRELGPTTWVASYANDVMAYIPSSRVLQEGGYEATITSAELAGSAWGPQTEELIIGKVHELVARVRSDQTKSPPRKLRIIVLGGHPDDPETGCGGLIALLAQAGHEVTVGYTTCFRGGRKIGNEPEAVVRRREATAACEILGAKPHFFDYAHEKLTADEATLETVSAWLKQVQPDIVLTHWPLDTHPNHHATSSLVWQSYLRDGNWNLYFFEVMTDQQTKGFRPELYLDIESVREIKRKACFRHASQKPDDFWRVHEAMHRRRGEECGVKFAEAYFLVEAKKGCPLLPVSFLSRRKD
ncbi:MAG: neutral/alkaline non-lysosomal ceramidase N-terminal domain-containing protein [Verrucomicrobia bacterium]|nr:neutral/alkaline non-lysosomal ceramidase N-terminal domain-containing protein [Verrucomicrobiota bacterium]